MYGPIYPRTEAPVWARWALVFSFCFDCHLLPILAFTMPSWFVFHIQSVCFEGLRTALRNNGAARQPQHQRSSQPKGAQLKKGLHNWLSQLSQKGEIRAAGQRGCSFVLPSRAVVSGSLPREMFNSHLCKGMRSSLTKRARPVVLSVHRICFLSRRLDSAVWHCTHRTASEKRALLAVGSKYSSLYSGMACQPLTRKRKP